VVSGKASTIKQRLVLCLVALATVSIVQVSASSFLQYSLRSTTTQQRAMIDVQRSQLAAGMRYCAIDGDLFRLIDATQRNDIAARDKASATLNDDVQAFDAGYATVFAGHYAPALTDAVTAAVAPQHATAEQAKAAAAQGQAPPETLAAYRQTAAGFAAVQVQLAQAIKAEIERESAAADFLMIVALVVTLLTIVAGAGTLAWAGLFVWRSVVAPLGHLTETLRAMAQGDYTLDSNGDIAGDEVAQMYAAAAVFRDTALAKQAADAAQHAVVNALSQGLDKLAAQDLEYRIESAFPADYEMLRVNFNQALISLSKAIGTVRVGAASVMDSIDEIRTASDDLSQRNTQQAASLEETAAAMSQVTDGVQDTATRAAEVQRSITDTHAEATEGGEVVTRAIAAMAAIEVSAGQIGAIVGLIEGIAFQTNLLALNAGVEAARAGDSGRGFAVVAAEVRALAQRSTEAAKDINVLITGSAAQVADGVALVQETGGVLGRIMGRVGDINDVISEIAASAELQAQNIQQVNSAVSEMDRVTQQNAAMVEQTTAATRDLANEAGQLSALVKTFRTRDVEKRAREAAAKPSQLRRSSAAERQPLPRVAGNLALAQPGYAAAPLAGGTDWTDF
jgi:methyl-accepting chemotaxis protein